MTRARDSLVRTRIGLANQLRDQLDCLWPGAAKVFCSVDTGIALAFLRRYPAPTDARGLGEQRLAAFLKRHGYTGRKPRQRAARAAPRRSPRPSRRARDALAPPNRSGTRIRA